MNNYSIYLNSIQEQYDYSFEYQYFKKSVYIKLSPNSALIELERTTDYKTDDISTGQNNVLCNAIKKTCLIHLLIYSQSLQIVYMKIFKNNIESEYSLNNHNMAEIYSLVNGELNPPFSDEWKERSFIESILNLKKVECDSRISALLSLICAKNKTYNIERFVNLWISFNGMYSFFSKLHELDTCNESKQLELFISQFNQGDYKLTRELSSSIANKVTDLLKNYKIDDIDCRWLNDSSNRKINTKVRSIIKEVVKNKIGIYKKAPNPNKQKINQLRAFLKYNNTAYTYLLVEYAYYYRCKYIHANTSLPLLCYENEYEIKCIALVNRLLEDYICNNLYKWFSEDYIKHELKNA
ncbi:hypothetical protein [Ruminococcus flavefaciens]|uniref:hypothetical protein n=1 Tax=Ruminococcus flavefaciens TaxID=1265 RepID=UPI0026EB6CA8|nr:hypothetical protein [Ruminococcus flavefaciens]